MKRFCSGNPNDQDCKKPKLDANLDDLWGDDLDEKDVDDCFLLATQICQQSDAVACTQRNNVSILPSYNAFHKNTKPKFTSTQSNPELNSNLQFAGCNGVGIGTGFRGPTTKQSPETNSSTSFKRARSFDTPNLELEMKIKRLEEQFVAKDGEISILRTQLKDIRLRNEQEQTRKHTEFSEKLTMTTKQLNSVKSVLEFKNLEIANLKQKVVEVAKLNSLDLTLNTSHGSFFKRPKDSEKSSISATTACKNSKLFVKDMCRIEPAAETVFPLQGAIEARTFDYSLEEKYLINLKHSRVCRNTIPFLRNQMLEELTDQLIRLQPKTTTVADVHVLNLKYVYCDLLHLMGCTAEELRAEQSRVHINKIVCVSEQLMHNLHVFLLELKHGTAGEATKKGGTRANVLHLGGRGVSNLDRSIFSAKHWCANELGVSARQSIACVAEILPHSPYLQGYLIMGKRLVFHNENEEYTKDLPYVKQKLQVKYRNSSDYLKLIESIVTAIRELKKVEYFPGLLSAVVVLLNKICLVGESEDTVNRIVREIVLCYPSGQVFRHLVEFVKNASLQDGFVGSLCRAPFPNNNLKIKQKEKILYYTKETCILKVLCVLLDHSFSCVSSSSVLVVYSNIVRFVLNCFKSNVPWLHYQENKHCDCLSKIVELSINIIYRTANRIRNKKNFGQFADELPLLVKVFKPSVKLLHILNFKASDMIIKYISMYSHYKTIIRIFLRSWKEIGLSETDVEILEELNTIEEVPDENKMPESILWD